MEASSNIYLTSHTYNSSSKNDSIFSQRENDSRICPPSYQRSQKPTRSHLVVILILIREECKGSNKGEEFLRQSEITAVGRRGKGTYVLWGECKGREKEREEEEGVYQNGGMNRCL